jgi:hypothetical protein
MENRLLFCAGEPFFQTHTMKTKASRQPGFPGQKYFLLIDGNRIGPFLSTGSMNHLEVLLRGRGIRMSVKTFLVEEAETKCRKR